MTFLKSAALAIIVLMATAVSSAQQKFPLHSGEWTATTPDPTPDKPPFVMLFCLNDELWTKALNANPSCQIQQLNITPMGGSYSLNCPMKAFQMTGKVKLTFDGMTHMTANASFDTTVNGKTTHMDSTSDYRWKGLACDPNADMNLKFNKQH